MSQWGNINFKITTDGEDDAKKKIDGVIKSVKDLNTTENQYVKYRAKALQNEFREETKRTRERAKSYEKQLKNLGPGKDALAGLNRINWAAGGGRLPNAAKAYQEEMKKSLAQKRTQNKMGEDFGKKLRKTITGVLIDLHWLRVLGQSSQVLANSFSMISKSLGYVADMILMPMIPAVIELSKFLIHLGAIIRGLPSPFRNLLTMILATAIALTTVTVYTVALGASAKFASEQLIALGIISGKASFSKSFTAAAPLIGAAIGAALVIWMAGQAEGEKRKHLSKTGQEKLDREMRVKGAISPLYGLSYLSSGGKDPGIEWLKGKIPKMASGGVVTGSTIANVGEAGAEAIIPLSSISSTFSNIFGGISESLGNILGVTMGKAISGGGGYGALASDKKGSNKGFNYLGEIFFGQTKVSNQLLGGILAVLMGGTPPSGGTEAVTEPKSIWDYILTPVKDFWDWVTTPVHSVWEWITITIKTVWDFIDVTVKTVWDFIETPVRSVWEWIATPVRSIWEFISTSGTPAGTDVETPVADAVTAVADLAEVSLTIRQVMASLSMAIPTNDFWDRFKDSVNSGLDIRTALEQTFQALGFELPGAGFWEKLEAALNSGINPQTGLSQSVTANDIGTDIANSILQNLVGGETVGGQTIREPFVQAATSVVEEVTATVTEAGSTTGSFLDTVISTIGVLGSMVTGGIGNLANGVGQTIVNVSDAVFGAGAAIDTFFTDVAQWFSSITGAPYGTGGGGGTVLAPMPAPPIPVMASGGYVESGGMAFLHPGETVVPAKVNRNGGMGGEGGVVINNPTFVVSGRDERAMFEEIMRLMKLESSRVRNI
jgi:hypothetical protein